MRPAHKRIMGSDRFQIDLANGVFVIGSAFILKYRDLSNPGLGIRYSIL